MKKIVLFLLIVFSSAGSAFSYQDLQFNKSNYRLELPAILIEESEISIYIESVSEEAYETLLSSGRYVYINDEAFAIQYEDGKARIDYQLKKEDEHLFVQIGEMEWKEDINPIPLWMSIIPPLIAILLALLIREVITSLFIGIFSGVLIMGLYSEGPGSILFSFLKVVDTYVLNALNDTSHISVIIFSMTIAAVVSVISKNGGMRGVVNRLEPYAHNPKSGQLVIWFMGILIFFDDYANTLVVGNTMRPVADRLRISREKLAYIVDSTAAPVAAIAFITTWIGAELGYIANGIESISEISESPYSIFLNSLSYSFYPVLTIIFIFMLIYKQRDFGSMYKAEIKARSANQLNTSEREDNKDQSLSEFDAKEGVKEKAFNAVIPIIVIVFGAIAGMLYTGYDAAVWQDHDLGFFRKLSITIGNADSFIALLWSSVSGLFVAIILSMAQGILKLEESINTALHGYKTMIPAMAILILAWSLAYVTEDMHTALFLKSLWSPTLSPIFIPAVVFILSALVSFSTGSSWGTMAILYPLLLPASYQIATESGMGHEEASIIFYNVVSVILAGSVFGDHCSPISDTTILSSLASSCNHIDHVRTQLPYALTVGLVSIVFGSIPAAMGISSWILFPICIAILFAVIHFVGKRTV
jgi:Na+/H+ antiporter NhaC